MQACLIDPQERFLSWFVLILSLMQIWKCGLWRSTCLLTCRQRRIMRINSCMSSLVGVATKLDHSLKYSSPAEKDMLVSDYDTQVLYEVCASRECSKDCHMEKCRLCFPCLREPERQFIKAAYLEHKHRGEFRRVYPPSLTHTGETRKDSPAFSLSSSNQLMAQWFKAMCQSDISWCV